MHLEVAILVVKGGDAQGLIAAMAAGGTDGLLACNGCNSVKIYPGVENPDKVLFLIEWDSVDAHAAAKGSEGFAAFIKHASPFFGVGGSMEHFDLG